MFVSLFSYQFSSMARGGHTNNSTGARSSHSVPSQNGPGVDVGAMMTLMQGMVQQLNAQQQNKEVQDKQITLLRDGLL